MKKHFPSRCPCMRRRSCFHSSITLSWSTCSGRMVVILDEDGIGTCRTTLQSSRVRQVGVTHPYIISFCCTEKDGTCAVLVRYESTLTQEKAVSISKNGLCTIFVQRTLEYVRTCLFTRYHLGGAALEQGGVGFGRLNWRSAFFASSAHHLHFFSPS